MLHTELKIYRTGADLLGLAFVVQEQLPRAMKRFLGEKIVQHCVDMLDLMADVVIALVRQPRTAKALVPEFVGRMQIGPLRRLLRRLYDGKVLRIAGWVPGKNAERIYGVGDEPSVPAPTKRRVNGTLPSPPRIPVGIATPMYFADRFCAIWSSLETPCTVAEIAEDVGSTKSVVRPLLHRLRKANPKLVRIAGYERTIQRAVIFERSGSKDAMRPKRQSEHESYVRAKSKREVMELHRVFTFAGPALTESQNSAFNQAA